MLSLVFVVLVLAVCPGVESDYITLAFEFETICECSDKSGSACKYLKFHKFKKNLIIKLKVGLIKCFLKFKTF